jgi:hypothetical protein
MGMTNYLVSYRPLIITPKGREAVEHHNQMPFVDHSNRREPHLESEYPGISSICVDGVCVPKLEVGDRLLYITVKGHHYKTIKNHWCLVAALKVKEKLNSHEEAALWYKNVGEPIPSNCVVDYNEPLDIEATALEFFDEEVYKVRAEKYPSYLICDVLNNKQGVACKNLKMPKQLYKDDLMKIFYHVPVAEGSKIISDEQFEILMDMFV